MEDGIFWNMEYFRIWNILEYGIFFNIEYGIFWNETLSYNSQNLSAIFWNMAYFEIWNTLEYGICWNMEYSGVKLFKISPKLIRHIEEQKIKHLFKLSHNLCSRFWNMESFVIWNILQYGIFWNIAVRKIFKSYPSY